MFIKILLKDYLAIYSFFSICYLSFIHILNTNFDAFKNLQNNYKWMFVKFLYYFIY